jgi:uncharacterized protein HemX
MLDELNVAPSAPEKNESQPEAPAPVEANPEPVTNPPAEAPKIPTQAAGGGKGATVAIIVVVVIILAVVIWYLTK